MSSATISEQVPLARDLPDAVPSPGAHALGMTYHRHTSTCPV